jgi:hypothetical protein
MTIADHDYDEHSFRLSFVRLDDARIVGYGQRLHFDDDSILTKHLSSIYASASKRNEVSNSNVSFLSHRYRIEKGK